MLEHRQYAPITDNQCAHEIASEHSRTFHLEDSNNRERLDVPVPSRNDSADCSFPLTFFFVVAISKTVDCCSL
jgi:hypothetical protein